MHIHINIYIYIFIYIYIYIIHKFTSKCQCVKLLTVTHELYTKMFRDQKFQVSSCV